MFIVEGKYPKARAMLFHSQLERCYRLCCRIYSAVALASMIVLITLYVSLAAR